MIEENSLNKYQIGPDKYVNSHYYLLYTSRKIKKKN